MSSHLPAPSGKEKEKQPLEVKDSLHQPLLAEKGTRSSGYKRSGTPPPCLPSIRRSPSGELILGGGDHHGRYSGLTFPPTPGSIGGADSAAGNWNWVWMLIRMLLCQGEEFLASRNEMERAAAIIEKAVEGPPIPQEVLESDERYTESMRSFLIHKCLSPLWNTALIALVFLLFVEVPPWCHKAPPLPCGDPRYGPTGGLPYLDRHSVALIQIGAAFALVWKTRLVANFMGWKRGCNSLAFTKSVLLAGLFMDGFAIAGSSYTNFFLGIRLHVAYYIRIPTVVIFSRSLRTTSMDILRMARDILDFILLVVGFLAFSSWLALLLFHMTEEGRIWFPSYQQALLNMFALLTASSQPDMQIPAYEEWRPSVLFFVVFFAVGLFALMNLLLAVIFDNYKQQVAKALVREDELRKANLCAAFRLLDKERRGWIDGEQIYALLRAIHKNRIVRIQARGDDAAATECSHIDTEQDFKVREEEFPALCHVLVRKFPTTEMEEHWVEHISPRLFHSPFFQNLMLFTRSGILSSATNYILVLNFIALAFESHFYLQNDGARQRPWFLALVGFGVLYIIEAAVKIIGRGFSDYWIGYRSRFDFCITLGIFAVSVLSAFSSFTGVKLHWIRYLEIARLIRLTTNLSYFWRYKVIARTFMRLIPSLAPLLGCLFCTLCLFNAIGVQWFGGLIYSSNPRLQDTSYLRSNYTSRNFNDFGSGMVTLFDLCIMSNWLTYMKAFVSVTGSAWARAFFIVFYVVTVLFILNLVVAFVLHGFLTQMKEEEDRELQQEQDPQEEAASRIDIIVGPSSCVTVNESTNNREPAVQAHGPVKPKLGHGRPDVMSKEERRSRQSSVLLMQNMLRIEMERVRRLEQRSRLSPSPS